MSLYDELEAVNNRETFLKFVEALIQDRRTASYFEKRRPVGYQISSDDWQSLTIEDYLETATSWLEDYKSRDTNPEEITWKKMAEFLYCGKIYE